MRAFSLAACAAFIAAVCAATPALAACGPDKLGTDRSIHIEPDRASRIIGDEPLLGLKRGEVILTFDDGPRKGTTAAILDTLKDHCVKATFFAVGRMAKANPDLARRIVREGHTIAHHTHAHERLPALPGFKARRAVERGVSAVEKAAFGSFNGEPRVPYFRYPYLARSGSTNRMVKDMGFVSIDANIDTLDWKKMSPSALHDRTMRLVRKKGRGIILMHDIQHRTVAMLPNLLQSLKDEGFRVVHLVPPKGPRKPFADDDTPMLMAEADEKKPALDPVTVATASHVAKEAAKRSLGKSIAAEAHSPTAEKPAAKKKRVVLRRSNTASRDRKRTFASWKLRSSHWIIR